MNGKESYLTEGQLKAIRHFKGPGLVIAGPGSGKTLVMIERAKYLISEKGISPEQILVTTFTERAANELKVRLSKSLGNDAARIHISTIHSLCKTLLEDYFTEHNLGLDFNVLDQETQKLFVRTNKFRLGIFIRSGFTYRWLKNGSAEDFISLYDFLTRNDVDVEELKKFLENGGQISEDEIRVIESYKKYIQLLEVENKIDFANLQLKFYKLICNNKEVLDEVQSRFQFILVDEYQDTSPLQDLIFRKIAPPQNNIFLVGDKNQSIYGFRGASIQNFENFPNQYPDTKTYFLYNNFRSTEHIVDLSKSIFKDKIVEKLKARRRKGQKSVLLKDKTSDSTARRSVDLIKKMKEKGIIEKYGDVALLFRTWKHSEEYVKYLKRKEIPHVVLGGGGLLDRIEITTMIYLISYITQKLYLGKKFNQWSNWWNISAFKNEIFNFSKETKKTIDNLPLNTSLPEFNSKDDLRKIGINNESDIEKIRGLNRLRKRVEESKAEYSLLKIFYDILRITGYMNRLLKKNDEKSKGKLFNLARLSDLISKYEGMPTNKVEDFLWFIYTSSRTLEQRAIENENTVKIMSVHKAKGLEFPVVFICSLLEDRFPLNFKRKEYLIPIPENFYMCPEELKRREEAFYEEERRLFYVGITRAQDNLIFTTSDKIRVQTKKRSRFLDEIGDYISDYGSLNLPIEMKYKMVEDVPNLSYSAINTYIDCPFRYSLVYGYGFVTPPSFMQNVGTFVHNVLQRIHSEMRDERDLNESEIEKFVDQYWIPVYREKKKDEEMKLKYLENVKDYYEKAKKFYEEISAIEEPFSYIGDSMVINGKVDLVAKDKNGDYNLIDFKARKVKEIKDTNVDKQLKIYNYCLSEDHEIDNLIAYTFLDNEKTEFKPEKEWVKNFVRETSKKIESGQFDRKKGAFCKKCVFKFCCGDIL